MVDMHMSDSNDPSCRKDSGIWCFRTIQVPSKDGTSLEKGVANLLITGPVPENMQSVPCSQILVENITRYSDGRDVKIGYGPLSRRRKSLGYAFFEVGKKVSLISEDSDEPHKGLYCLTNRSMYCHLKYDCSDDRGYTVWKNIEINPGRILRACCHKPVGKDASDPFDDSKMNGLDAYVSIIKNSEVVVHLKKEFNQTDVLLKLLSGFSVFWNHRIYNVRLEEWSMDNT